MKYWQSILLDYTGFNPFTTAVLLTYTNYTSEVTINVIGGCCVFHWQRLLSTIEEHSSNTYTSGWYFEVEDFLSCRQLLLFSLKDWLLVTSVLHFTSLNDEASCNEVLLPSVLAAFPALPVETAFDSTSFFKLLFI